MSNDSIGKAAVIRVPATTANIGPGFDSFGMALKLYNKITVELTDSDELTFKNVSKEYCTEDNLVYQGYRAAMSYMKLPCEDGMCISIEHQIPICRGLGSSAALLTAGVKAASELHGGRLTDEEVIAIATGIEGHPDNIAAAVKGGLNASMMEEGKAYTVRYDIHESIHSVVIIPDFQLSTELSRSVLPKSLDYASATYNISHGAVLLKAMEMGDERLIDAALRDRLHQDYRKGLIPGYEIAEKAAREIGVITYCLSGAGPTQLALLKGDSKAFAEKLREKTKDQLPDWTIMAVDVDNEGAVSELIEKRVNNDCI